MPFMQPLPQQKQIRYVSPESLGIQRVTHAMGAKAVLGGGGGGGEYRENFRENRVYPASSPCFELTPHPPPPPGGRAPPPKTAKYVEKFGFSRPPALV